MTNHNSPIHQQFAIFIFSDLTISHKYQDTSFRRKLSKAKNLIPGLYISIEHLNSAKLKSNLQMLILNILCTLCIYLKYLLGLFPFFKILIKIIWRNFWFVLNQSSFYSRKKVKNTIHSHVQTGYNYLQLQTFQLSWVSLFY